MARASVHEATGEGDVGAKTTGPTSESPKIGGMVAPNLVQVQHFLRQSRGTSRIPRFNSWR